MQIPLRKISAVLVSVIILGLVAVPQPEAAAAPQEQGCPNGNPALGIDHWKELYRQRGVTLCRAYSHIAEVPSNIVAVVTIVNLDLGAKMRVMSEVDSNQGQSNALFVKRSVIDWWSWVYDNVNTPDGGLFFGTYNGSYFTNTSSFSSTTELSYAQKKWNTITTTGFNPDAIDKRIFGITNPSSTQSVKIATWAQQDEDESPPNYAFYCPMDPGDADCDNSSATITSRLSPYFDASVGWHPLEGPIAQDNEYRTMVGSKSTSGCWTCWHSHVYILATHTKMTQAKGRSILQTFGAMNTMNLDGGNSTSYHTGVSDPDGGFVTRPSPILRKVPEVLVVFVSP